MNCACVYIYIASEKENECCEYFLTNKCQW